MQMKFSIDESLAQMSFSADESFRTDESFS